MSQPALNPEISIRHTTNKQLHTGLTSAQVNEMLQTVNVISSFQDYIPSPRYLDLIIDNHKEQISIECRKQPVIDLFLLSFAL